MSMDVDKLNKMANNPSSAGVICLVNSDLVVRCGRITNNRALPTNYTNPVEFFSGGGWCNLHCP